MICQRGTARAASLGLLSLALVVPVIAQVRPAVPQTPASTPGTNSSPANQPALLMAQTLPPAPGNGVTSPNGVNTRERAPDGRAGASCNSGRRSSGLRRPPPAAPRR